ncbi:hypothetical protein L7F22_034734 [Adiantum nelumboides]|nr:hypothetical protein [Adiantum nelumboides]
MICVTLLHCPFNVLHRSCRFFFLKCLKRIILAPFYKVMMADFFLADQLTSQVTTLRHLQYLPCYCLGDQSFFDSICTQRKFHAFAYLLSFLPFWWRLLQCLRRYYDEQDQVHLANGGKYLSAMVAMGCRLTFEFYGSKPWLVLRIMSSSIATIYQLYWDFVVDWGLLQPHSKNPWLRDQLILTKKSIYFMSMAMNILLRLAWIVSLTHLHFVGTPDHLLFDFLLASLEVIRRGHWNFYRLENEHLNNVGKFRAVKIVPLPFRDEFIASV